MPFVHRLRVRFHEVDAQRVVFNANHLTYADVASTEWWRAVLGGYDRLLERGLDVVVAEANARFLGPARFDDVLEIAVEVQRIGTTSMVVEYTSTCGEAPVAEVTIRYVLVDGSGVPTAFPDDLREAVLTDASATATDPV